MSDRKRLTRNMASLFVLQGANYLIPLITLPYLVRVLGPEKFGLIAFAQAFIQYFVMLTDYGFNLSATREIAIHRDNPHKVSEIFSAVMTVKFGLMLISFLLMSLIVFAVPKFRADWSLFLVVFLTVVGSVLFPVWVFQGLEQMKYIAWLTIGTRLLAAVAIFVFVQNEADYLWTAGIQAGAVALSGIAAWPVIRSTFKIGWTKPSLGQIRLQLVEGWHVFLSSASVSLYTNSNIFLLGLLTNPVAVGYFSAANKLVQAVHGILTPISQSIYPHISSLVSQSRELALKFIRKSLRVIGLLAAVLASLLWLFAEPLVELVLGAKYAPATSIVRWMAFIPFVVAVNNVFGIQTMLTFGYKREFSRILLVSGLVNLALIIPLATMLEAKGAAIAVLCTEIIVTVTMGWVLQRKGFQLFAFQERIA